MNIQIGKNAEVKIILVFEDKKELLSSNKRYSHLIENDIFKGENSEIFYDISNEENKTILLGMGKEKKLNYNLIRKAFFNLGKGLTKYKIKSAVIDLDRYNNLSYKMICETVCEGLLNSQYYFDKYLEKKKPRAVIESFNINPMFDEKEARKGINDAISICESMFFARDLANEPSNVIYPESLANIAEKELSPMGVEVEVLGKAEIEELSMNGFLSVAQGSSKEAKFIIMRWNGDIDNPEKIGIVGKGLTYDSGGYSLKPSDSMATMFVDMAGAAAVISLMRLLAKNKIKKNVVSVVAACENLISSTAYKPGDIISTMSGKTVEVLNTDAEGRITLADALYYISTKENVSKVIDVATLTGAVLVALGDICTGAISNNSEFLNELIKASKEAGEYVWELPNFEEYKDLYKSSVADFANTGPRLAGTINAGLFLENFVNDLDWVHLDIAGTSYNEKDGKYFRRGASGVMLKTLYKYLENN